MGAIPQVHIIVKGGHVSLEGIVMNQMDKTVAGLAANTVPGVFSVQQSANWELRNFSLSLAPVGPDGSGPTLFS